MDNLLRNCLTASSGCCQEDEIVADATINAESYGHRGYNRYSYVLNNPMKYVDPSGYRTISMQEAIYYLLNSSEHGGTWTSTGGGGGEVNDFSNSDDAFMFGAGYMDQHNAWGTNGFNSRLDAYNAYYVSKGGKTNVKAISTGGFTLNNPGSDIFETYFDHFEMEDGYIKINLNSDKEEYLKSDPIWYEPIDYLTGISPLFDMLAYGSKVPGGKVPYLGKASFFMQGVKSTHQLSRKIKYDDMNVSTTQVTFEMIYSTIGTFGGSYGLAFGYFMFGFDKTIGFDNAIDIEKRRLEFFRRYGSSISIGSYFRR